MMQPPPARNASILLQSHNLSIWWKIQEMRATLLELTMNKIEGVDGVHGVVLVLPSLSSSPLQSLLQSFLSSSRVHPCSRGCRERRRAANEW
jgi:hypothetical protein